MGCSHVGRPKLMRYEVIVIDNNIKEFVEKNHKHKIWYDNYKKNWATYVIDGNNKRRKISSKDKDKLLDKIINFYNKSNIKEEILKNDFSKYKEINIWDIRTATYLISPIGDVYSTLTKKWLSTELKDKTKTYAGNKYVSLRLNDGGAKWFSIPRLVCAVFNGLPPEELEHPSVDHIDSNPENNHYSNLRWIEHYENSSIRPNRGIGEMNSRAILTEQNVIDICNDLNRHKKSVNELAEEYHVNPGTIYNIKLKKTWYYISRWFDFT